MKQNKEQVVKSNVAKKKFSYSKGTVSINFDLRVDIKTELKECIACLEVAIEEMKSELANVK